MLLHLLMEIILRNYINRNEISWLFDGGSMEKLKLYLVTKSSTDTTFQAGDMIWLSENGDLNSVKGKGCLPKDEWNTKYTNDFECEVCNTHYLDVADGMECVRRFN